MIIFSLIKVSPKTLTRLNSKLDFTLTSKLIFTKSLAGLGYTTKSEKLDSLIRNRSNIISNIGTEEFQKSEINKINNPYN